MLCTGSMSSLVKPALTLFACLFVVGLAGEAQADKKVDWSEYLEPPGARAKPMALRDTPQPVTAKETPAKKKAAAKKGKAAKSGAKARKKTKKPRRR